MLKGKKNLRKQIMLSANLIINNVAVTRYVSSLNDILLPIEWS